MMLENDVHNNNLKVEIRLDEVIIIYFLTIEFRSVPKSTSMTSALLSLFISMAAILGVAAEQLPNFEASTLKASCTKYDLGNTWK